MAVNWLDYMAASRRTRDGLNTKDALMVCALGLTGEAGEIADFWKKTLYHGHGMEEAKLADECGDLLWYIAYTLDTIGGEPVAAVGELFLEAVNRQTIYQAKYPNDSPAEKRYRAILAALSIADNVSIVSDQLLNATLYFEPTYPHLDKTISRLACIYVRLDTLLLDETTFNIGEVLARNVEKLQVRYPAGFTAEASKARVDVDALAEHAKGV